MKKRVLAVTLALTVAASMMTGCGVVKVIKIGEEGKYTGEVAFDADSNVEEFWESKAVPELNEKAVDLRDLLTEANGDLKSLGEKYGKFTMVDSGQLNYVVKGTGTVEEVDTESRAGYILVKLDGYDGNEAIKIQVGPVYKGSSIRDSLDFIKYGDYKNQEEWAAVSRSINERIDANVVQPADPSSLEGKKITFTGAFTVSTENTDVLITPISLEAE